MVSKEELLKEIEKVENCYMSVGFTPYLAKKRDNLYNQLWKIK
jgi:hypothetical protein